MVRIHYSLVSRLPPFSAIKLGSLGTRLHSSTIVTCTRMHTHAHTHTLSLSHTRTHARTHTHTHAHTHTQLYAQLYMYMYIHVRRYTIARLEKVMTELRESVLNAKRFQMCPTTSTQATSRTHTYPALMNF